MLAERTMATFLQRIKEFLSQQVFRETPWEFVTSAGGEVSAGTPVAHVGFNATAGAVWLRKRPDGAPVALKYGGVGGSGSVNVLPSPVNLSFSMTQMPSSGRVYDLPHRGDCSTLAELKGSFVQFGYAGDFGPGYGWSFLFMGCDALAMASLIGAPPAMVGMRLPQVCMSARAFARFRGMSATLLPGNVGATFYLGALF
jgi:hypothetical protein